MCDVSYTLSNNKVLRNIFTSIQSHLIPNKTSHVSEKEQITDDLNRHESMDITRDFMEMHSDLPGQDAPSVTEMKDHSCEEIVSVLMNLKCAWSVIYYNSRLGKFFIGRDVFGRKSVVFSSTSSSITISYLGRPSTAKWHELPYAQVSIIDLSNIFSTLHLYSYLQVYPDEMDLSWRSLFSTFNRETNHMKDALVTVSRSISPSNHHDDLCDHLTSAIKSLLPSSLTSIGVCFSGGVDSLLISYLLLTILPSSIPVHLINVAFGDDPSCISRASDRSRSIDAYRFLRDRFPQRDDLHLILVDVSRSSLQLARSVIIPMCTRPSSTVLDESIASVLYFAFRGIGIDFDTNEEIQCTSPIRFMGSGADEIFAGYARHRHRYERDGNSSGIAEECETELRRLGVRNGGRDSRVSLALGIEVISPFLHDDLVEWANGLNIEDKADLSLPRGIGEKKIIREVLSSLGAPHSAPKQAMQFGSGMVKLENQKSQKGSHISTHLDI